MDLKERNESMRSFFNEKIDTYDDTHAKFMDTKRAITSNLAPDVNEVLDLGVGTGLELFELFKRFPNAQVTAIDISEKMLEKLKTRPFIDHIKAVCGDFFSVDFGDGYDAVISTSALHHFLEEDKRRLYEKIYDSLKENGEFINCDKVAFSFEEEEQMLADYYEYKDVYAHNDTPLFIDREVELLKNTGFRDVVVRPVDQDNYRLIKAKK